ncbi:probable UDP-arabinose 4-epimerase 2 isoform X2 [Malus domestica]
MDIAVSKRRRNFSSKFIAAAGLITLCIVMFKQSHDSSSLKQFSYHGAGITHVLVTGGAGYIGSHAALRLLKDSYRVTIVDNLSRGNIGAVRVLQQLFPEPGRLQFIYADLGDAKAVNKIFSENAFDAVMHFAAVAYVGESTLEPLRYYHNITSNTLLVLEAMAAHNVKTLIYSSTCATYGEPRKMPITEETEQQREQREERETMVKFLKPNKAVINLQGRYAGRKAVIVRAFDEGTRDRPYGHCLVAGIKKYPSKVIRKDSAKKTAKKSRVKAFVKLVNYQHLMPTRYTLDVDLKDVVNVESLQTKDKKVTALKEVKKRFEERFKTGKNRWFFTKLRF